jgi:hypothetical protein
MPDILLTGGAVAKERPDHRYCGTPYGHPGGLDRALLVPSGNGGDNE